MYPNWGAGVWVGAQVDPALVRAAADWSSGAMVARYTRALSGELVVEEFQRSWSRIEF